MQERTEVFPAGKSGLGRSALYPLCFTRESRDAAMVEYLPNRLEARE